MYSRVRMESHINRSFCKYNVMLAKFKTTQSLTNRRADGSYETRPMTILSVRVQIRYLHPMGSYNIQLVALPSSSASECPYCLLRYINCVFFRCINASNSYTCIMIYALPLYYLNHISYGFNSCFTYNNICLACIS